MNGRQKIFTSLILLLLLAAVLAVPTRAETIKVSIGGGYDEIHSYEKDNIRYVSLSELAGIIGGSVDWDLIGQQIAYADENFRFTFIVDAPFIRLNDSLYNLTYPVELHEGQLYVPVVTFTPVLNRVTPQKITWDGESKILRIDSEYFNVTDFTIAPKANGLLVEIFISKKMNYDIFVTEGNWVNISIRDANINTSRILSRKDSRYMYSMKVHQVGTTGQISFRLKRDIKKWHHKIEFDPPRIQISIPDVNFEIDLSDTNPVVGPDKNIDVIIIDPGHGGKDYGAIGANGSREKDIVLDIAKELARIIRKDKEFKVILTRDRDKYVSLDERARIANDAAADLFISLHANASPKKRVKGWNVFFLAEAKNDSARAVQQLENSFYLRELASNGPIDEGDDPILGILNEMIMTEFQAESHDFAMMVDHEFRRALKTPARGVDQAGFFVLNKIYTPSVLVETAFISNPQEERTLRSRSYQKEIAESIYKAIKRFKAKYESM